LEDLANSDFPGPLYGNSIDAFYGAPRTVTVSLAAKFY
jgi:hypothetical protein